MSLPSGRLTLDDAAGECGDVIGTGIGGATFGYAMARAGQQVLFCERGDSHMDQDGGGGNSKALTGHYPEQDLPAAIARHLALERGLLRQAGRASALLDDVFGRKTRSFMLFLGSGTGGPARDTAGRWSTFSLWTVNPGSSTRGTATTARLPAGRRSTPT